MSPEIWMDELKDLIDGALDRYLPSQNAKPRILHNAMRYSVFSGGKRLRPIIAVEACRACGGHARDAMAAACAIEMVHTYSLVHDDLPAMDDDDLRRGVPTCHKKFGEANAILVGDALLTLAFGVISREYLRSGSPDKGAAIIKELSDAIGSEGMVGGQAIDLELQDMNKSKAKLDFINLHKTAKLFEVSAKTGAIISGAGLAKVRAMAAYGSNLGMAFQMADDITDGESYPDRGAAGRAYRDSAVLIEKAKKRLSIFGRRSDRLKEIADNVLRRVVT